MPFAYEYVPGLFELSTWDEDIHREFGLQGDWRAFRNRIEEMQRSAPPGERIKVVYTARHGEAEHNILWKRFGLPDNDMVHILHPIVDPVLTPNGRAQAIQLAETLSRESQRGMPLPTRFFTSPMRRPGETTGLTWGWLYGRGENDLHSEGVLVTSKDLSHGVPAEVIEEIREHLHVHRCDERLAKRDLVALFPSFTWPDDMPDQDTVWQPTGRETEEQMIERAARGLEKIMRRCNDDVFISVTAHAGVLRAVYKNLGVPSRRLDTGEMNVLVLRVRDE